MQEGVEINALIAEDSYSVAQNRRRHDDGIVSVLFVQSMKRDV